MALLALPVAILIAGSVLPTVNSMAGLELRLGSMLDVGGIATLSALTLMIGLLAGLYPAAFMSRTVPGSSLLSTVVQGGGKGFRQTLVVTQFVTTLVLVMTTMVMGLQRRYIQNTNLGFDREHVITTPVFALGDEGYYSFKETLLATTDIMAVSSGPILGLNHNSTEVSFEDPATGDEKKIIALDVDHDYDKVFGLSMESGRFFSQSVTSDTSEAVVINPTAARLFSSGENKVPDVLRFEGVNSRVIGVVNEFHHASMHMPLQPVVMRLKPGNNWMAMVRLAPGNVADRLATIREAWNRFQPERPFTYNFLEDRIAAQYVSETRLASVFGLLSMTAIALACMGLFGLAAFMAARRTREIGIRKVLGATVCSIISLLSTDYLRLVGIAFVLAIPIAYIMSRKWLEEFSFQIEIPWWGFLLVGTGMMLLTIVSVGYQAARVAMLDPVETLKSE